MLGVNMPKYNPAIHKVKVHTWGTKGKPSNGLDNFVNQELFGGNVGHASIEMTLPRTEETQKMIEKYCMEETFEQWKAKNPETRRNKTFDEYIKNAEQRIPCCLVKNITTRSVFNDDGELVKNEDEHASEISYYKIDFSFWPTEDKLSFYLSNLAEDMVDERIGHPCEYSETAKAYLHPEERIHRGTIGAKSMTYSPSVIAHQRDMDDKEFEKIGLAIELQKLTEALETEDLLVGKVKALKAPKIDGSLSKICHNMGLETPPLVKEYMVVNPLERRGTVNIKRFKGFLLQKVTEHIEDLKARKKDLNEKIKGIDKYLNQEEYVTRGIPPDHTQKLPYRTETGRGLDPEAMLKKMREITAPDAPAFDLHTRNCSKTSTAVLKAGASGDPLLERVLGEEALGAIGTPQQVIGNAQRAIDIIEHDRQNTLFTRIANSDILNRAMGRFIADYQKAVTRGQKAKAIAGIVGIGILKTPEVLVRAIVNSSATMSDITSAVGIVFKNANSLALKIGVGILSVIPLTVLAPFAIVEKVLQVLAAPFKALANWFNKKPPSSELDGQITSPLSSKYENEGNVDSHSKMAGLLNKRVAKRINENTQVAISKKGTAMDILAQFEIVLEDTPKVVTLSAEDFDKLNKYIQEKNDPTIAERFQKCCKESLSRANKLSPHKLSEVDAIVDEIKKAEPSVPATLRQK